MSHLQPTWTTDYSIRAYETDLTGSITLPTLCQYMQDSALQHAQHLGVGYEKMLQQNLIWVLARQLIRVIAWPDVNNVVTVHTWPSGKERLSWTRDFELFNQNQQTLIQATSVWFTLDFKRRRPQRLDSYYDTSWEIRKHVFEDKPEKLSVPQRTDFTRCFRVGFRDIDPHKHVNNIRYLEWMIESLDFQFQKSHQIREMEINYLNEAFYGEELNVITEQLDGLSFLHQILLKNNEKELCRARTKWNEREIRQ